MESVLAEVVGRVDQNAVTIHPGGGGPFGCWRDFIDHVIDDTVRADAIADPVRTSARPGSPGVRTHQAGSEFGGRLGHRGIIAAPAVIDQVCAGPASNPGYLRTPGVDADQLVGE